MKRRVGAGAALLIGAALAGAIGVSLAIAKPATPAKAASPTQAVTPARPAAVAPPRPMLWKVSDADNDIYLLGSFHALKASDYPLAASVDAAFADAEVVAFEISPQEMASPELAAAMLAAGRYPPGVDLQQVLDAREWGRLEAWSKRSGVSIDGLRGYEPWFLSLLITLGEMAKVGFDPGQGLDNQLMARAAAANKRTLGLETGADQIRVLDGMSALEQRQSLADTLDEADNFKQYIDKMHALWRNGDDAGLDAKLVQEFKREYAQLYKRMNVDRNQAWLPKLRRMLDEEREDDALVVVGSMHLVGSDGLVSQLRARGYRVQRL